MTADREFSLMLGGPIYQLWLKTRLARAPLELHIRRVVVLALLAWLPLLVLSLVGGRAWSGAVAIPFLFDIEAHVRFLVGLPLLVLAEGYVHRRLALVFAAFTERRIVSEADRPALDRIVAAAMRVRNSVLVEALLLGFVFVAGHVLWRSFAAPAGATWYATPDEGTARLSSAGWWYVFASLPLFQFLLLRWLLRVGLWIVVLLRVSRLDLRLTPTHPDRCAGLGFLSGSADAFLPILAALGSVVSGGIANRILYEGRQLPEFKFEVAGLVGFGVLLVLGPLLCFAGHLARARRRGVREYGALATRYGQEFETKWLGSAAPPGEALLGSADIQSLADLANGFAPIRDMRPLPFGLSVLVKVALATAAPLLPLVLTMVPIEAILQRLVNMVF